MGGKKGGKITFKLGLFLFALSIGACLFPFGSNSLFTWFEGLSTYGSSPRLKKIQIRGRHFLRVFLFGENPVFVSFFFVIFPSSSLYNFAWETNQVDFTHPYLTFHCLFRFPYRSSSSSFCVVVNLLGPVLGWSYKNMSIFFLIVGFFEELGFFWGDKSSFLFCFFVLLNKVGIKLIWWVLWMCMIREPINFWCLLPIRDL